MLGREETLVTSIEMTGLTTESVRRRELAAMVSWHDQLIALHSCLCRISLPLTSFTAMNFSAKLTGQLDFVPGGHAGVYVGRAAHLLLV